MHLPNELYLLISLYMDSILQPFLSWIALGRQSGSSFLKPSLSDLLTQISKPIPCLCSWATDAGDAAAVPQRSHWEFLSRQQLAEEAIADQNHRDQGWQDPLRGQSFLREIAVAEQVKKVDLNALK